MIIKIKKYRLLIIILLTVFWFLFGNVCHAVADYEEETENAIEKADGLLSMDTAKSLLNGLTNGLRDGVKQFSKVFAAMLFTTFMLGIMRLMTENNAVHYAGEICLCAFSFSVVSGVCENITAVLKALESFMLSSLPVMTTLYTVSSAPASGAVNYGTTVVLLNACNVLFTSVIIPAIKCITVFAVVSFISRSFDFSGISLFIKNTAGWMFGLLMCLMSSIIAFQNVISNSKDAFMGRTVRFAAARFIPVIGATVSESAKTVSESLRLVRSVTGVSGIFAIIGIIAAPVAALLICRFFLNICSACARLFSCNKAAVFLCELSGVMNLLLGVVIGMSLILILILGIFAKAAIQI